MKKTTLAEKIKRRLGYPMIKVELDPQQITDAIDLARSKYIKWAAGNATQETYFTMMLSGGQTVYDMPVGTTEVLGYSSTGVSSGINTLFTIDNFLYNQGMYEALFNYDSTGYSMISYHLARDFLETIRKYTPDKYNYKYHKYHNQIEIQPAPPTGNALVINDVTYDSPGFILLRTMMLEGASLPNHTVENLYEDFYGSDWILDYATAECKITLGMIRRKFGNFASLGNVGISLDGDTLVSEGKEEKIDLEEKLKLEEVHEGLGVEIGF
jgi:hypothetical protein